MKTNFHTGIRPNPTGDLPEVDPTAFVDPAAQVIGKVKIGPRVYVGPGAVIRADEPDKKGKVSPIILHDDCSIQDGVIIHALEGSIVEIGKRAFISHGCIVHGPCTIGDDCFLGFRVLIFSSVLEQEVWVGTGATILEATIDSHTRVPAGFLVHSHDQADHMRAISQHHEQFRKDSVATSMALREAYLKLFAKEGG